MSNIGVQPPLPILNKYLTYTRNAIGAIGESIAAKAFEGAGYKVATTHERRRGDLTVISPQGQVFHVEVKIARRGKDGKWRFTLVKDGFTDHRDADIVVLLCAMKAGYVEAFVVPVEVLRDKRAACITSWPVTYTGYLAPYRQNLRKLSIEGLCTSY